VTAGVGGGGHGGEAGVDGGVDIRSSILRSHEHVTRHGRVIGAVRLDAENRSRMTCQGSLHDIRVYNMLLGRLRCHLAVTSRTTRPRADWLAY
jgi:hypothetical protein